MFTGRRDGLTSDKQTVDVPSPSISWEEAMAYFKSRGLSVIDMATLLGQSPFSPKKSLNSVRYGFSCGSIFFPVRFRFYYGLLECEKSKTESVYLLFQFDFQISYFDLVLVWIESVELN